MTDKSKRDELFALADGVVETILEMSDEEVLAELEAEGVSAADAGKAFDSLADSARMKAGRKELSHARELMNAERHAAAQMKSMTGDEARALIERAAREIPEMTQAARNATSGKMPDREAFELLEDLITLGFDITEGQSE